MTGRFPLLAHSRRANPLGVVFVDAAAPSAGQDEPVRRPLSSCGECRNERDLPAPTTADLDGRHSAKRRSAPRSISTNALRGLCPARDARAIAGREFHVVPDQSNGAPLLRAASPSGCGRGPVSRRGRCRATDAGPTSKPYSLASSSVRGPRVPLRADVSSQTCRGPSGSRPFGKSDRRSLTTHEAWQPSVVTPSASSRRGPA